VHTAYPLNPQAHLCPFNPPTHQVASVQDEQHHSGASRGFKDPLLPRRPLTPADQGGGSRGDDDADARQEEEGGGGLVGGCVEALGLVAAAEA